jgi:hypothetical protein
MAALLRLCAQVGLVTLGSIAVDGTKMGSDAALDASAEAASGVAEGGSCESASVCVPPARR